jgi:hypothetical protein
MTTSTKPVVKGPIDGNIFGIVASCSVALRRAGMNDKIQEMRTKIENSESYDAALCVCMEYVDFDLSDEDAEEENEEDDSIHENENWR